MNNVSHNGSGKEYGPQVSFRVPTEWYRRLRITLAKMVPPKTQKQFFMEAVEPLLEKPERKRKTEAA